MRAANGLVKKNQNPGSLSSYNSWSIEAMLPSKANVVTLADILSPGSEVYLSTLPDAAHDQQIKTARLVYLHGLKPILHLAARYYSDTAAVEAYITRAVEEANVDSLLIAGDLNQARGNLSSSYDILKILI
jgi:methylenetetrahydrofolate reductase (NADPH)